MNLNPGESLDPDAFKKFHNKRSDKPENGQSQNSKREHGILINEEANL